MPRSAPAIHSSLTICFKAEFGLQAGLSIFLQGDLLVGVVGCGPGAVSAPPSAPGLCATERGDSQNAAAICWHRPPAGAGVMPAIASSLSITALGVKRVVSVLLRVVPSLGKTEMSKLGKASLGKYTRLLVPRIKASGSRSLSGEQTQRETHLLWKRSVQGRRDAQNVHLVPPRNLLC